MPEETRDRFVSAWSLTDSGRRLSTLERFEVALLLADAEMLDRGVNPFQDAASCIQLRNWIAHYRPQQLGHDLAEPVLSARLRGKFPSNSLMEGQGNVWFPDHALGAGCATWAIASARALTDECMARLKLEPVYRSVDEHEPTPESSQ